MDGDAHPWDFGHQSDPLKTVPIENTETDRIGCRSDRTATRGRAQSRVPQRNAHDNEKRREDVTVCKTTNPDHFAQISANKVDAGNAKQQSAP